MEFIFSRRFEKEVAKLSPTTKRKVIEALDRFLADHTDTRLRAHPLAGRWHNFYSIDVTGDIRAVFTYVEKGKIARFEAVGSHSKLYK